MCILINKLEEIDDIVSLKGIKTLEQIYCCNKQDCKKICSEVTEKYNLADIQADYLDNQVRDTLPDDELW